MQLVLTGPDMSDFHNISCGFVDFRDGHPDIPWHYSTIRPEHFLNVCFDMVNRSTYPVPLWFLEDDLISSLIDTPT